MISDTLLDWHASWNVCCVNNEHESGEKAMKTARNRMMLGSVLGCVCWGVGGCDVCVCVCEREREREREQKVEIRVQE